MIRAYGRFVSARTSSSSTSAPDAWGNLSICTKAIPFPLLRMSMGLALGSLPYIIIKSIITTINGMHDDVTIIRRTENEL